MPLAFNCRLSLVACLALASAWTPASIALGQVSGLSVREGVLRYTLERDDDVTVELYASSGKRVGIIYAGAQRAGHYQLPVAETAKQMLAGAANCELRLFVGGQVQPDTSFGDGGAIQLGQPVDVEVDATGNLFVLDRQRAADGKSGICKLDSTGQPVRDFGTDGFVEVPAVGQWLALDGQGRLFIASRGGVQVFDPTGKPAHRIDGVNAPTGGAVAPDEPRLYVRTGYGRGAAIYELDPSGGAKLLLNQENDADGEATFIMAPLIGLYAGPALAAGPGGRVYMSEGQVSGSSRGTVSRFQAGAAGLERRYFFRPAFKDCIGLSPDGRGMIFVAERGTVSTERDSRIWESAGRDGGVSPAALWQLWDNDEQLWAVTHWTLPDVRGLRDVAVTADGAAVYLLEDADNFGIHRGEMKSPLRNVQGSGRLWRYTLTYRQTLTVPMEVGP